MRYLNILLLVVLFSSCSDNIEDGNETMQGLYNDLFFRSTVTSAHIDQDGRLIIEGSSSATVRLQIEQPEVGVYDITADNDNQALFTIDSQLFITEGENTGGRIEIENITENSVSGNFFFDARLNGVGERLNFQKGVFFEVPFEEPNDTGGGGNGDDDDDDTINENFQALVDGSDFNAQTIQSSTGNSTITIIGGQADVFISITMPAGLDTGDHDITADGDQTATYTQEGNAESATDGTLSIDVLDENEVSGSFSFTTENGIEVTQGSFEIAL